MRPSRRAFASHLDRSQLVGFLQKLLGMITRALSDGLAREHAGELFHPFFRGQ